MRPSTVHPSSSTLSIFSSPATLGSWERVGEGFGGPGLFLEEVFHEVVFVFACDQVEELAHERRLLEVIFVSEGGVD